jgi:hypothetical protein
MHVTILGNPGAIQVEYTPIFPALRSDQMALRSLPQKVSFLQLSDSLHGICGKSKLSHRLVKSPT